VVLHVDDDPNDTELLQAATRNAGVQFDLRSVEDGDQAMAYLAGTGVFADRRRYPLPAMVLLDLKMPRATGFELLRWIRRHPTLGQTVVVVLSGSELQDDKRLAYETGANSYEVKPLEFDALVRIVKRISSEWLSGKPAPQAGSAG
jgi:CheY-like chemotaxis protein